LGWRELGRRMAATAATRNEDHCGWNRATQNLAIVARAADHAPVAQTLPPDRAFNRLDDPACHPGRRLIDQDGCADPHAVRGRDGYAVVGADLTTTLADSVKQLELCVAIRVPAIDDEVDGAVDDVRLVWPRRDRPDRRAGGLAELTGERLHRQDHRRRSDER